MGSVLSLPAGSAAPRQRKAAEEEDDDLLDSQDRVEDIAKFPYVEFTGQDSITCPTCQGTGCIPTEQVNELVALIPYSDQRLRPQRTKLYVLLSVLLCLLVSGLVVFFLFPHSVLVEDDGIKVVRVWFDRKNSAVLLAITATLRIRNSNFYSVAVASLTSQVQYMNTVVGTQQVTNISSIPPLSDKLVNFTVKAELGGAFSYVYSFCTYPKVKVHNIVVFMRSSVKFSYVGHTTQSSVERYRDVQGKLLPLPRALKGGKRIKTFGSTVVLVCWQLRNPRAPPAFVRVCVGLASSSSSSSSSDPSSPLPQGFETRACAARCVALYLCSTAGKQGFKPIFVGVWASKASLPGAAHS
ncbi:transmembrane protein 106C isoform X1 [Manacus candei]|uniref:transmembrane protein 106C isoform X1 n=1 Tax=Manacus candei TaxID=415023 RepID=UPI002227CF22|nr:transmembrane protein 106C isoform X1 [Manacus candei]XP_051631372.1 transmembrane protein 106C isoform X1 [Manacus candei]XP_051631373.1 transmembrane protein 106C isoform X1 [Manacus candei]XP_051631374.1 transmembrane protein 106C isoform X1 [Manacus candei]